MMTADRILERLLALSSTLRPPETLEERLNALADASLELLQGEHASVRLLDASRENLLCGARAGGGAHRPPAAFDRHEGVLGWVLDHGNAARVDDTSADERFVEKDGQGFGIGSLVAVPVWSGGEVVGVLAVTDKSIDTFTAEDQALAQLLANAASPELARARLQRLGALR